MEIGSFIELEFPQQQEYYRGTMIARLNSGRAGIVHAARVQGCNTVYLPYYQCDSVRDFLQKQGLQVRYYLMDEGFTPMLAANEHKTAVVIVNYFGIMGEQRLRRLAERFNHVIIDNSQAFFSRPLKQCLSVYSARKFIGVADGAYVIGRNACKYLDDYEQDFSSDTSLFLLQRIEYGCAGKSYAGKCINEQRLQQAGIKKMSKLTHTILDGTNYDTIKKKRRKNFAIACRLFDQINQLRPGMYYEDDCVPMVYPLVVEHDRLLRFLLANNIYQGHWWSHVLREVPSDSYEYWLARYMIPITIDQRYGERELRHCYQLVMDCKEQV